MQWNPVPAIPDRDADGSEMRTKLRCRRMKRPLCPFCEGVAANPRGWHHQSILTILLRSAPVECSANYQGLPTRAVITERGCGNQP